MILDLSAYDTMTEDERMNWLEWQWDAYCNELGVEFGSTWAVKPFDPQHDHRIGCCDPDYGCCDDSLEALIAALELLKAA